MTRKYSKGAAKEVEKAVHSFKHDGKYKSREQATAVGLNKARKKGEKVPSKEQ